MAIKSLATSALWVVLSLVLLIAAGCGGARNAGNPYRAGYGGYGYGIEPGYGYEPETDAAYGPGSQPGYGPGSGYGYGPGSGYGYGPGSGYGYGPRVGPWVRQRGAYRSTGDNERCSDRREVCQKWSSKRDRYVPDYGETRRQYGRKAEKRLRQRTGD